MWLGCVYIGIYYKDTHMADIDLSMKKRVLHYVWNKYMSGIQEPDREQLIVEDVECFYDAIRIKDEQERNK